MEILGLNVSISDIVLLGGIIFTVIFGYAKIVNRLDAVTEQIMELEKEKEAEGKKIVQSVDAVKHSLESRISPLESRAHTQEAAISALNATLLAIQNSLSSVSNRLDTIITQMLENKSK